MRKIFKLNESYIDGTEQELINLIKNINQLKEGARRYILWKDNIIDDDNDAFPDEINYVEKENSIWIDYTNGLGTEKEYEVTDIEEFNNFLKNPQFYYEQDKYNL